ncbi:MAG: ribonuclease R [bacterium]
MKNRVNIETVYEIIKRSDSPLSERQIMKKINANKHDRQAVKDMLKELDREDKVEKRGEKYSVSGSDKTAIGRIEIKQNFGFLIVPGGDDIFVGRDSIGGLLNGDEIEVYVKEDYSGRKEGTLKSIVKRTDRPIVCKVKETKHGFSGAQQGREIPYLHLLPSKYALKDGDTVIVKFVKEEKNRLYAEVTFTLAGKDGLENYKKFVLEKREIRDTFAEEVLTQAKNFSRKDVQNEKEKGRRRDLSDMTIVTIDPLDAKDYDDAVSLEKNGETYTLGVHIADVSHYVTEGSPLDIEAYKRGFSLYMPREVVPMLPHELSSDLCSLKEKVDRLAFSIFMTLDKNGEITGYNIEETIIHSAKRFTYEEVEEILTGKAAQAPDEKILKALGLMNELRQILNRKLIAGGMVDFSLGEPKLTFDEKGVVSGIIRKQSLVSHKLVEYFMIYANVCAAAYIEKHMDHGMYRVHDKPAARDIEEFNTLMKGMGVNFKLDKGTNFDFQKMISAVKENTHRQIIEKNLLRAMKLAVYSEKNSGHFGLGLEKYTHFTSPIRRYPDLVVHRLIKNINKSLEMKDPSIKTLRETAGIINENEERIEKAESDVFKVYALDFLRSRLGNEMKAVVTKITKNGITTELLDYPIDGFILFENMNDDYYVYDVGRGLAFGKRTGKVLKHGMELKVTIASIDMEMLRLGLEI